MGCEFVGMCVDLCVLCICVLLCCVCVVCTSGVNVRCCCSVISTLSFVFCFVCQPPSLGFLTSIILEINKWLLFTSPSLWC